MEQFLYKIASRFYSSYAKEISNFTFVFPNRRSGVFFQRYLSKAANKPILSPSIKTISELFTEFSDLRVLDRTKMLFTLYEISKELNSEIESFDEFIYWGEILLNDFDDIDKYLVDAQALFSNITDIKEIDSVYELLDENQKEIIKSFWSNFLPVFDSEKKKSFINNWSVLYSLYIKLKTRLANDGFAYEGMLFRDVVENLNENSDRHNYKKIVFIGFNALTEVERRFMIHLKNWGIADFYWDYESFFLHDKENKASFFCSENLRDFPSELSLPNDINQENKNICVVGVPSAVGQTKYIPEILKSLLRDNQINTPEKALDTAIVLGEESLLIPTLYAIPSEFDPINVTMGYALTNTPISGFVNYLLELQKQSMNKSNNFYHQTVCALLSHKYITSYDVDTSKELISEIKRNNMIYIEPDFLKRNALLSAIFINIDTVEKASDYILNILNIIQQSPDNISENDENDNIVTLSQLDLEFVYNYYIIVNRLTDILKEFNIGINVTTYFHLLSGMIESITVPFKGEPLSGLQIMGVLETRVLDFKNVILLSANDGTFPKKSVSVSFIPPNLRKGFKLSTGEHQDAIFAYHFYHLISRAENIYILYDTRTSGSQTGEVTRYVQQLKYHYGLDINESNINYNISVPSPVELKVKKDEYVKSKLEAYLRKDNPAYLSASTINTYINCPLAFYIKHVERVEEADSVTDNIEADIFGTIFHAVMEDIYEPFKDKEVTKEQLQLIIKDKEYLEKLIRKRFSEFFLHTENETELKGYNYLIGEVLLKYVIQILKHDLDNAPFSYIESEMRLKQLYQFSTNGYVNLKGSIDRVDLKDGVYRIIDYKTGSGKLEFKDISQLFDTMITDRPKAIMQTFMYSLLFGKIMNCDAISPQIFYLKDFFKPNINNEIEIKASKDEESSLPVGVLKNFYSVEKEFKTDFDKCIAEIFDYSKDFEQTLNEDNCKYCDLKNICKR